jgi:hypothetical protein
MSSFSPLHVRRTHIFSELFVQRVPTATYVRDGEYKGKKKGDRDEDTRHNASLLCIVV